MIDTFIVSPLSGDTTTVGSVVTHVRYSLEGFLFASATAGSVSDALPEIANSVSRIDLDILIDDGRFAFNGAARKSCDVSSSDPGDGSVVLVPRCFTDSFRLLSAFLGGTTPVDTGTFDVELNKPFQLETRLVASVDAKAVDGPFVANAFADTAFFDTLSYNALGPVFLLPEGFTINSLSGSVVNNRWVGASPVAPVPEPASLTLLGSGLAGVALRARRRYRLAMR